MAYFNRTNPFKRSGVIQNIGQDGIAADVTQGGGLGVRQHDDVMLSWGLSRKVTKFLEIPNRDWAVITLRIPAGLVHHAERRFLEVYDGQARVKIITGLQESDLPPVESQLTAFNQVGPVVDSSVQSVFEYRGIHTSNPITATIDESNIVDWINLYGASGNSRTADESISASLRGRHYEEGIHTVLIENLTSGSIEFTYAYDWHEY